MSKPMMNPFFEADFSKMMDVSKFMGEFKMPSFNFEILLNAQRKNVEAFTALNQAVFESMQALGRRQAEVCRQACEQATSTVNAVMTAETPEDKVMRQAEASKAAVEQCLANMRDIAETIGKCNAQAVDAVHVRLNEGLEELRGVIRTNRAV